MNLLILNYWVYQFVNEFNCELNCYYFKYSYYLASRQGY